MSKRKKSGRSMPRPWQPLVGPHSGVDPLGNDTGGTWFGNDLYSVMVEGIVPKSDDSEWPPVLHLTLHRRDRNPRIDWRHLQRIKNEITSVEHEAVQLFPAENRLVDCSNEFHLWVFPAGFKVPFGYTERLVMDCDEEVPGSKQRPLDADVEPTHSFDDWIVVVERDYPEDFERVRRVREAVGK